MIKLLIVWLFMCASLLCPIFSEQNGVAMGDIELDNYKANPRTFCDYADGVVTEYIVRNDFGEGTVDFNYQCSYSWDEGYSGWIDSAKFNCINLQLNNVMYSNIGYDAVEYHINNGSAWQRFLFSGGYTVIVSAQVDEWGELEVSARLE